MLWPILRQVLSSTEGYKHTAALTTAIRCYVNIKQSRYRPGVAQRAAGS